MKRIFLLLLVCVFMVQSVNAEGGTVSCTAYVPAGVGAEAIQNSYSGTIPSDTYYYSYSATVTGRFGANSPYSTAKITPYYDPGGGYSTLRAKLQVTDGTQSTTLTDSASGTITSVQFRLDCAAKNYKYPTLLAKSSSTISYSTEPLYTASGEACAGGSFTYYADNVYIDSTTDNYSFSIADGVEYQIYHDTADEWHNFTATGNNTWVSCPGAYTVSGTLIGADTEGINNALMALVYKGNMTVANTISSYSSTTGAYSFYPVYPGDYFIIACGNGPCYPYAPAWFSVVDDVSVIDLLYPEKISMRIRVLDNESNPLEGYYIHVQDILANYGGWLSTDSDGYTSYTPLHPSTVYLSVVDANATEKATTTTTANAQYPHQVYTITLPGDDPENETVPVIPPQDPPALPTGDTIGGGTIGNPGDYACTNTLTVDVQDNDGTHTPLNGVTVKLYPTNTSITGSHTGITDAAGEYTFSCTNATLSYNVEAKTSCYSHVIEYDEGYSGTVYIHMDKTLTAVCGFDDGTGGDEGDAGGPGTGINDTGDPDITQYTATDDTMKTPIFDYLWMGTLLTLFVMCATYYKRK